MVIGKGRWNQGRAQVFARGAPENVDTHVKPKSRGV